ncbi:MAG: sugar phosphate isomerase/epimerase family protein, partial [Propionivibrio sp.]
RATMQEHGLAFAGFHWLLAKPAGLHFTAADPAQRKKAQELLKGLLWASGELGGGNLVFGSPEQRRVTGISLEEGKKHFIDGLMQVADIARDTDSVICVEALAKHDTNLLNTLQEVEDLVKAIGHPAIQGMFDFHNCADEVLAWPELITSYQDIIKHVHLNREDGSHPTPDQAAAYKPAWNALKDIGYKGWVSLEIFSIPERPEEVMRETAGFWDCMQGGG